MSINYTVIYCDQCIKIMRYDLFATQLMVLIFFVGTSKILIEPSKWDSRLAAHKAGTKGIQSPLQVPAAAI